PPGPAAGDRPALRRAGQHPGAEPGGGCPWRRAHGRRAAGNPPGRPGAVPGRGHAVRRVRLGQGRQAAGAGSDRRRLHAAHRTAAGADARRGGHHTDAAEHRDHPGWRAAGAGADRTGAGGLPAGGVGGWLPAGRLLGWFAVMVVVAVLVGVYTFFYTALVMFTDLTAGQALRTSMRAGARNLPALLVYMLVSVVFSVMVMLLATLVTSLLGI